jgi:hypothetical protein
MEQIESEQKELAAACLAHVCAVQAWTDAWW